MREVHFCECGDHAFAPLTKGYMAMVSPEDAHLLTQHWRAHVGKKYVTILSPSGGKFILARMIARPNADETVDHINHQTMDNRRPNLRVCSQAENMWNRRPIRGRALPQGVRKSGSKYAAIITHGGERMHLGYYQSPEAASRAYRAVALALRGEFARCE